MLIGDYITIPKRSDDPDYIYGFDYSYHYEKKYPDFWSIKIGDGKITNIEHIIIWICLFWGFLRIIDLTRLMEKYNKD